MTSTDLASAKMGSYLLIKKLSKQIAFVAISFNSLLVNAETPSYTITKLDDRIGSINEINDKGTIVGSLLANDTNSGPSLFVATPSIENNSYSITELDNLINHPRYRYSGIGYLNNNNQFIINGFDLNYTSSASRPNIAYFYSFAMLSQSANGWQVHRLIPDENELSIYRITGLNNSGQIIGDHMLSTEVNGERLALVATPTQNGYEYINLGKHPDFPEGQFSTSITQSDSGLIRGSTYVNNTNTFHPFLAQKTNTAWEIQPVNSEVYPSSMTSNRYYQLVNNQYFEVFKTDNQWTRAEQPFLTMPDNSAFMQNSSNSKTAINDNFQVIGKTLTNPTTYWFYQDHIFYSFNELINNNSITGWSDLVPTAINNKGQIVGHGNFNNQKAHFLLSPISDNTASGITIDGDSSDWAEIISYQDEAGENLSPVDIQSLQITGDEHKVYIAYHDRQSIDPSTSWARQILIDSDYDSSTGFKYYDFSMGGDFLIAGNDLYQYSGNGETWEWIFISTVQNAVNGNFAELAINRDVIGSSNRFKITFYGANSFINNSTDDLFNILVLDLFRNSSEVVIDGNNNEWSDAEATVDQPNENSAPVDFEKVWFKQDSQYAYFAYQNRLPIDLSNRWSYVILIDSDQSTTGYQHGSLRGNTLLLGNELYQYAGSGTDWNWAFVKHVDWIVNGTFAEIAIDKADFNHSNDYKLLFYGANSYVTGNEDDSVFITP